MRFPAHTGQPILPVLCPRTLDRDTVPGRAAHIHHSSHPRRARGGMQTQGRLNVQGNVPVAANRGPENVNTYVEREKRGRGVSHTGNYTRQTRSLPAGKQRARM